MRSVIKNYSFNVAAKTVTLTDFSTVLLERLALITDTTANKIIYNFADPSVTTATVSGNVVTLASLPSGVVTGDKLRIDYENATGDPIYDADDGEANRSSKGRQSTTISNSTAETTIVPADATHYLDLYGLILTNTSATTTKVTVRDATGAGTPVIWEVPANDTRGFMVPKSDATPQTTLNNNWTAMCATAVTNLEVTAFFIKN